VGGSKNWEPARANDITFGLVGEGSSQGEGEKRRHRWRDETAFRRTRRGKSQEPQPRLTLGEATKTASATRRGGKTIRWGGVKQVDSRGKRIYNQRKSEASNCIMYGRKETKNRDGFLDGGRGGIGKEETAEDISFSEKHARKIVQGKLPLGGLEEKKKQELIRNLILGEVKESRTFQNLQKKKNGEEEKEIDV